MTKLWLAAVMLVVTAMANAQTYTVLYNFGSHQGDPEAPTGVLAQGSDGGIYGTSSPILNTAPVDVFRFTPSGVLTVIHDFGLSDNVPSGGVTLGTDGRFYGVIGHIPGVDFYGAVFKLTASGNLNVLHVFQGGADAQWPQSPPIETFDGNFYGTSPGGGSNCNCGTVYKMTPAGTTTLIHVFDGTDGNGPQSPPMQATNGNLYGTTWGGGLKNDGTVFEISPSGKFSVIFNFHFTDGGAPLGQLVQAQDGDLYGTTVAGGPNNAGVVFKISHGTYTVLHYFTGGSGGSGSLGLVQATDGNFYGLSGGGSGNGTIVRISPSGDFATIYSFPSDGSMGSNPNSTLFQHTNGLLYGTTQAGGSANRGVFFSFDIGAGPFVTFLPAARAVGHTVKILGQGFTGTTAVSFNGTAAATFTALTDTLLIATVPAGATTGFITVTTPSGTLTSNKQFQVKPQITGFSPTSGAVGTSVVITGVSLSQTSKITFGSAVATSFTADSDTQVTVTVPAGATSAKIGVTTTGAPAYSATAFTVTQ